LAHFAVFIVNKNTKAKHKTTTTILSQVSGNYRIVSSLNCSHDFALGRASRQTSKTADENWFSIVTSSGSMEAVFS
jgi:hypothetical protein